MAKSKNNNAEKDELLENFDLENTLKSSLVFYQQEIEKLREENLKLRKAKMGANPYSYFAACLDIYNSQDTKSILQSISKCLEERFDIIELNVHIDIDGRISNLDSFTTLNSHIAHYTEQGIIEWIAEQGNVAIIPNILDSEELNMTHIMIAPAFISNKFSGFIIAKTSNKPEDFSPEDLNGIKLISSCSIAKWLLSENIKQSSYYQVRIDNYMSYLSSISLQLTNGTISNLLSDSIEAANNEIKGNLKLIQTGVGNQERRLEIIEEKNQVISKFISKIKDMFKHAKYEFTTVNFAGLCEDIIDVLSAPADLYDIDIITDFDNIDMKVYGQIEQLLVLAYRPILLSMMACIDGGTINIGLYKSDDSNLHFVVSDNRPSEFSFSDLEDEQLIFTSNDTMSDYFIISQLAKANGGKLSGVSEIGKGTTLKIVLPIVSN